MTSIEWLEMELLNKMNGTPIVDKLLFDKAKEMHKQEIIKSQTTSDKWKEYQDWLNEPPEISDEEIEEATNNPNNDGYSFREGAKWYREQLKKL
jgi:hypothetical protein